MEQLSLDIGENTNSILTEQNRTEQNKMIHGLIMISCYKIESKRFNRLLINMGRIIFAYPFPAVRIPQY